MRHFNARLYDFLKREKLSLHQTIIHDVWTGRQAYRMKAIHKTSYKRSWAICLFAAQLCGCWALLPSTRALGVARPVLSTTSTCSFISTRSSSQLRDTNEDGAPASQSKSLDDSKTDSKTKPSSKKKRFYKKSGRPKKPSTWQEKRQKSLAAGNQPLLSLNLNLDALVRGNAPDRAQELFTRIRALHADGYYATAPDGE